MYVRWQSRKLQRPEFGWGTGWVTDADGEYVYNERGSGLRERRRTDGTIGQDVRWTAVLVENVRVDGKPTQRHIAMLGGITESANEIVHQRRQFWDGVHARLDRLGNRVSLDDRRRIEAAVALKVPRLSCEEYEASIESYLSLWVNGQPDLQPPYRPPTSVGKQAKSRR